ncbi:MAG: tetratricopeptide repeat protein [Deltaproteobacteria bacterium]|nr:tetratricopeptide repeat protein [Deltaproteobacteria bacterium]
MDKTKIALVFGCHPNVFDIEQFIPLAETCELSVITSSKIGESVVPCLRDSKLALLTLPYYESSPTFLPGLENILKGFDVVIVKDRTNLCSYQAVKAKSKHLFRLIVWIDNLVSFPGEELPNVRVIRDEVGGLADYFLVQSDAARKLLRLEGEKEEKILYVPPLVPDRKAISSRRKAEACESLGLCDGDFVIAAVGNIAWEKNLVDLLHAIRFAKDSDSYLHRRGKLLVYGKGAYVGEIKKFAVKIGIDNDVVFAPPNKVSLTTALEASSALYCAPKFAHDSFYVNPSLVLMTMVYQIPILACRLPVIEEFVGKHRIDFCMGSPSSLAKAITKLAHSPALAKDIAAKNKEKVTRFYPLENELKTLKTLLIKTTSKDVLVEARDIDKLVAEAEKKLATKQYLDAVEIIESALGGEEVPHYHLSSLYRIMGDCFAKLGNFEESKNAYIKATEADELSAKPYIGLGTITLLTKKYEIAVLHFQKALTLSPNDEMANLGLGLAFQALGQLKEAAKWVHEALKLNAENLSALYSFVRIGYETDDYERVETCLRRYLALHPQNHEILYSLGGVLYRQGKFDEAAQSMRRILDDDENDHRAHRLLSMTQAELGRNSEASLA